MLLLPCPPQLTCLQQAAANSSSEATAGSSRPPAVNVGTTDCAATAGGIVLGPYEGRLAGTKHGTRTRFTITDLDLRKHAARQSDHGLLFTKPAKQAAWEKVSGYCSAVGQQGGP